MQAAFDDLDVFFDLDDFAEMFGVVLSDGTTRNFPGIFDAKYLNPELGEYEADTDKPRVTCKSADVVGILRGDVLTRTKTGEVFDLMSAPQHDGTGQAMLELSRQEGEF